MEELSGLDASFLFLETEKIPMHIGGVAILEGSMQFEDFFQYIEERVHLVDKLTQKLVNVPLSLDKPYWIQDTDFDLDDYTVGTLITEKILIDFINPYIKLK